MANTGPSSHGSGAADELCCSLHHVSYCYQSLEDHFEGRKQSRTPLFDVSPACPFFVTLRKWNPRSKCTQVHVALLSVVAQLSRELLQLAMERLFMHQATHRYHPCLDVLIVQRRNMSCVAASAPCLRVQYLKSTVLLAKVHLKTLDLIPSTALNYQVWRSVCLCW